MIKLNPESKVTFTLSEVLDIAENKPEVQVFVPEGKNHVKSYYISKNEK